MGQRVKRATRESGHVSHFKGLEAEVAGALDALGDSVLACQKPCLDGTHIVAQVRKATGCPVLSMG